MISYLIKSIIFALTFDLISRGLKRTFLCAVVSTYRDREEKRGDMGKI